MSEKGPVDPSLGNEAAEKPPVDVSEAFRIALEKRAGGNKDALLMFDEETLDEVRREPTLNLTIDWSSFPADKTDRQNIMRKLKAMLEYRPRNQQRVITIPWESR